MVSLFAPGKLGLIILLAFSSPSWAQSAFEHLDRLEKQASAAYSGFDLDQFNQSFDRLRKEYQRLNKPQEEVWALYAFDFDHEAQRLESELRMRLMTEEIVGEESLVLSGRSARVAKLESGLQVILREKADHHFGPGIRQDVLVYEISRALAFHLVPVTVRRPYKNSMVSLQVMIMDSKPGTASFIHRPYQDQKLHILDYLTGQLDRHQDNWLIAPGGRVVAIDNDIVYGNELYSKAREKVRANVSSDDPPESLTPENRKAVERLERKLLEEPFRFPLHSMELTFVQSRLKSLLSRGHCEDLLKGKLL